MLSLRRVARIMATLIALTSINLSTAIFFNVEIASAYTQSTPTSGTAYGGGGGSPNGATQNCSNAAVVAIGATKSGDNLNGFMFVCKGFNDNATLSSTEATTTVFGSPTEGDRCSTGQIGIGVRVIASNGGSLVGGVGLICGNPMSQGSQDTRSIIPNALSAGTVYTYTCPSGQLLAGFYLRTGALVDQITPKCSSFSGFVYAAVGAPSLAFSDSHSATVTFAGVNTNIADTPLTYTVTATSSFGTESTTGSSSPITIRTLRSNVNYTFTVTGSNSYGTSAATSSAIGSATLPGGETDTALTLNGSQYMTANDNSDFDITGAITLEAWVKLDTITSGAWNMVINKDLAYEIGVGTTGYWSYALNGTSAWQGIATGIPAVVGEWHHVAITRAASTNQVNFYYDGSLTYTGTADGASNGLISNSTTRFTIGARDAVGSYNSFLKGQIDHVMGFDSARSATDIRNDMNSYISSSTSNLKFYYDFNEINTNTTYNRASGAPAVTDLYSSGSPTLTDVKVTSSNDAYTFVTFPRTYLNSAGGWKTPSNLNRASALVVGGGGGGGGGYQGGGGGAGGFLETTVAMSPSTIYPIKVGTGGRGAFNPIAPTNGDTSTAFGLSAIGGGAGMSEFTVNSLNVQYNAQSGGSGGAGSHGTNRNGGAGTAGQGNAGAYGTDIYPTCSEFAGGGGGGAGSAGFQAVCADPAVSNLNHGGFGGSPKLSFVTNKYYAGGGGGSLRGANGTALKRGQGGNGDPTTAGDGAISSDINLGIAGSATSAPGNSGGGGGAGSSTDGTKGYGGNGGSGVVVIRWITALKPTFTPPKNAYLNVGMTETFTVNVASDSATALLTRTFRWESTTGGSSGTYSVIKQGTGPTNAFFSWVPSDTSTTGPNYLYRVVVTDSDTAGLFIVDTSTAVYAVINKALVVTGNSSFGKTINVAKSETFTITLGTSTYTPILTKNNPGISIDTSTAGFAIIKIADTLTVGTYYETLTVTDSVSASVITPLTIRVIAPPNLLNTGEIITDGLILNLEAGNSKSIIAESGTATSGLSWIDLSGNGNNASTGAGVNTGAATNTTCNAPAYSGENGGAIKFSGSDCYYLNYTGNSMEKSYTAEIWFKLESALPSSGALVAQARPTTAKNVSIQIGRANSTGLIVGFWDGTLWRYANCPITPTIGTWTHVVGTYDGTTMRTYVNGSNTVNGSACYATYSGGLTGTLNTQGIILGKNWLGDSASGSPFTIGAFRIYSKAFTAPQVLANYNATRYRFSSDNFNLVTPMQKYGSTTSESFTISSGADTKTVSFAIGSRTGLTWDTTTVTNGVNLNIGNNLFASTHVDTVTVTDAFGASTYLPIKIKVSQADTLTVYFDTPTALSYTGNQALFAPVLKVTGLTGLESGTASASLSFKPAGTTCATGGTCAVGDIGPAGGVVFMTPATSGNGKYYEAAPANWTGTDDLASVGAFCSAGTLSTNSTTNDTYTAIGWGDTLTALFDAGCTGGVVKTVAALSLNGYSDWFIPNSGELLELKNIRTQVGLINANPAYWSVGTYGYWASTGTSAVNAASLVTSTWTIGATTKTDLTHNMVRPVRMFSPCWAIDTCTSLLSSDTPTAAGTYALMPSNLAVGAGSLNNYFGTNYVTTTATINKINQVAQQLPYYNIYYPSVMTINPSGGNGSGAISYAVTDGITNPGCTLYYKKLITSKVGVCNLTVVKAADRNYNADTATAVIWFIDFVNNQPTNQVGSGTTIALNGINTVTVETGTAPTITSVMQVSNCTPMCSDRIEITGSGFGLAGNTDTYVKFWRNKLVTLGATTSYAYVLSNELIYIYVPAMPAGITSGPVTVGNKYGIAVSSAPYSP